MTTTVEQTRRARLKRGLAVSVKLAVSVGLVAILAASIDFAEVGARIARADPLWLAAALGHVFAIMLVGTSRWVVIVRTLGANLGFAEALRYYLIGLFFNQALPSSIGGDGVRMYYLWRHGAEPRQAVHSVLLDRVAGLALLTLFGTMMVPLLHNLVADRVAIGGYVLLLAGLWTGIGLLFVIDNRLLRRLERFRPIRLLLTLSGDARRLVRSGHAIVRVVLLSAVFHGITISLLWSIDRALGGQSGIVMYVIALVPTLVLMSVPISVAGWGVREQTLVFVLGSMGVSTAHALSVSILFGLFLLASGLPGAVLWLRAGRHHRKTTMSVAEHVPSETQPPA